MIYENEFKLSNNKKEFISLMSKNYPKLSKGTYERRWYDLKKYFSVPLPRKVTEKTVPLPPPIYQSQKFMIKTVGDINNIKSLNIYNPEEMSVPGHTKLFLFLDMYKYKFNINKKLLRQYKFNEQEINWLENKGLIRE